MTLIIAGIGRATVDLVTVADRIAPIWPAIGVGVAAALFAPRYLRVAVMTGGVAGEVLGGILNGFITTSWSELSHLSFWTGIGADALMVVALPPLLRWAFGPELRFDRTHRSVRALLSTAAISTVAATIAVLGFGAIDGRPRLISAFAVGNLLGVLLAVSFVLVVRSSWTVDVPEATRPFELAATATALVVVSVLAFATQEPVAFLLLPVVVWMSIRFGPRAGLPAAALVVAYATARTAAEGGPFGVGDSNDLERLQFFSVAVFFSSWLSSGHALRADDERRQLRSTLDAVPDLVLVTDRRDGPVWSWPPPKGPAIAARQIMSAIEVDREDQVVSVPADVAGGRERFFEVRSVPVDDTKTVRIVRDISVRQHSIDDLQASENKWRTMAQAAFAGMVELDRRGAITFVSQRYFDVVGGVGPEVIGRSFFDLAGDAEWGGPWQEHVPKWERGEAFSFELTRRTGDHMQWFLLSCHPLFDAHEQQTGSVFFFADLTDVHEKEHDRRALEARLAITEEAERRSIARRLHDGPVQQLVAVDLHLDLVSRALADTNNSLATSQRVVRTTIEQLRQTLSDLVPPDVADGHLLDELVAFGRRVFHGDARAVTSTSNTSEHPAGDTALTLFTIGREAIVNAATHGDATTIHLDLTEADGSFCLTVSDDGVGIPDEFATSGRPGHLGLRNMRERAHALNGRCEIHRGSERGTIVTATIPHRR